MCSLQIESRLFLLKVLFVSSAILHVMLVLGSEQDVELGAITELTAVSKSCPPWKYDKYHNSSCVCGDRIHNAVKCEDDQPTVQVLTCHCMSYSDYSEVILVGKYPYLCTDAFYTVIHNQTDIGNLCNHVIQQNRQGQMCGKCLTNFAPSPYSYTFECADCSKHS